MGGGLYSLMGNWDRNTKFECSPSTPVRRLPHASLGHPSRSITKRARVVEERGRGREGGKGCGWKGRILQFP